MWAITETIERDRDLVLAHSLQRPENAQKIVGVVGAGHVPGVRQLWEQVPTRESRALYDSALLEHPPDCKTVGVRDFLTSNTAVAALALGFAAQPWVRNSCRGKCTGARRVIPCTVYQCSPRHQAFALPPVVLE